MKCCLVKINGQESDHNVLTSSDIDNHKHEMDLTELMISDFLTDSRVLRPPGHQVVSETYMSCSSDFNAELRYTIERPSVDIICQITTKGPIVVIGCRLIPNLLLWVLRVLLVDKVGLIPAEI